MVLQHSGQAVGAQQQTVARLYVDLEEIGAGAGIGAQSSRDHRALGMHPRLGFGDLTGLDEIGNQGMVAGQLLQLPVMQQVRA